MKEEGMKFKIGELAAIFDMSVKTLRLYDKMDLLCPDHIDTSTGYHYYSREQVNKLNTIQCFRKVGFTPQETAELFVQKLCPNELCRVLRMKNTEIKNNIEMLSCQAAALQNMEEKVTQEEKIQKRNHKQKDTVPNYLDSVHFDAFHFNKV